MTGDTHEGQENKLMYMQDSLTLEFVELYVLNAAQLTISLGFC